MGRDLLRPEAWDAVRELPGPFGLAATREELERAAARPETRRRAGDIATVANFFDARRICSYGVGTGTLELALVRTGLDVTCTDFAPRTVERLRELLPQTEVVVHDLRTDEPLPGELHLLHRVDTELADDEWRAVLPRFREPVLFVPGSLLGVVQAAKELARRLDPRVTRAGYVRTEAALRALWEPTHEDRRLSVGDAPAYLLTPRRRAPA